jgi:hypothetical protein
VFIGAEVLCVQTRRLKRVAENRARRASQVDGKRA